MFFWIEFVVFEFWVELFVFVEVVCVCEFGFYFLVVVWDEVVDFFFVFDDD